MSTGAALSRMEEPRDWLPTLGAGLVLVVVLSHLVSGTTELLVGDGRLAYVLLMAGAAVVPFGLLMALHCGVVSPRPVYASLAVLFVLYLFAYVEVHAIGTLETAGIDLHGSHDHGSHDHGGHDHEDHGQSTVDVLADHLAADPIALVSKTAEAVGVLVLTGLALRDRRDRRHFGAAA